MVERNDTGRDQAAVTGRVNRALDDSVEDLPDSVTRRLRQARQSAVHARRGRDRGGSGTAWMALAASVVLAVLVGLLWPEGRPVAPDDGAVLLAMAELDEQEWVLVQDLQFAYWLSEQPDAVLDRQETDARRPG